MSILKIRQQDKGENFETLLERKAADNHFLRTGEQWDDLDNVQQRRLIDRVREEIDCNH